MNNKTNKMIKMAFLLSLALVINYFESFIQVYNVVPGVKIGLANSVGLIVLCLYKERDYVVFNFLKVFIFSLLRSGFGSAFFISLTGTLFATIFTLVVYRFTKASIYGLSVTGAFFHSLGQILMVMVLYNNVYMINYLSLLETISIISGVITAFIASVILSRLPSKMIKE